MTRKDVALFSSIGAFLGLFSPAGLKPCTADQLPPPVANTNGLPTPQRAPISGSIQELARAKISINVQDADAMQIVAAVGAAAGKPLNVEVRFAALYKVSLKVADMPLEDVLRAAAGFGHCDLYILPDKFLITRPSMLRPAEQKLITNTETISKGSDGLGKGKPK